MGFGVIKISDELLLGGHEFPATWKIIDIWKKEGKNYIEALIKGPEFPEVKGNDGYKICNIIVHTERVDFDNDHPAPDKRIVLKHEVLETENYA